MCLLPNLQDNDLLNFKENPCLRRIQARMPSKNTSSLGEALSYGTLFVICMDLAIDYQHE